jgi:AhpD family alkylhydroperoxidase
MTAETARVDYASVFRASARATVGPQRAVDAAGLEPLLLELAKMRASQINGCAYCLDVHSKAARALGESEQRLHLLTAWREAPCHDSPERAALAAGTGSRYRCAPAGAYVSPHYPTSDASAPASGLGSPQHTHNHEVNHARSTT